MFPVFGLFALISGLVALIAGFGQAKRHCEQMVWIKVKVFNGRMWPKYVSPKSRKSISLECVYITEILILL